jgi:acetaldehyde dehydrogenase (acetylating)
MVKMKKIKIAIIGSGNIGTDLLIKILRSKWLECSLFSGRNLSSPGMHKASSLGVNISDRGIKAIEDDPDCCDLVFDATSAIDHLKHWPVLKKLGKVVIDMTPSRVGMMCVPAVNLEHCLEEINVNMVTCGGQASTPLAYLIGKTHPDVSYIEVVSSIASKSAGPATRLNIDEYMETTANAASFFSGCANTKAILILNPAIPCVNMQTTVFATVGQNNMEELRVLVDEIVAKIQVYVPKYQLIVPPTMEDNRIIMTVRVQGLGDYMPSYAGNLDIINCAAIVTAEEYAKKILKSA